MPLRNPARAGRFPDGMRLALVALLLAAGCATPIAPTGGPVDTTPPSLVSADPAAGATRVTSRTLTLTFSERLATTAATAVTVTPTGDAAPDVRVRARQIEVTLPTLRDSTTYVVTIGTGLRDQHNVALRQPIAVAFTTGDAIDQGRIAGVVRQPGTGRGVGGLAVWAYALPDSTAMPDPRTAVPDYRTETGAEGTFRLEYLRPGPYAVVAVADRNRNGRADATERFAAPPRRALLATADSAATPEPAPFWVTTRDTIPPEPQRVRTLSDRRFAVRFAEPVQLAAASASAWALADSASGRAVDVTPYQPTDAPFEVLFEAAAPLPATVHRLTYAAIDTLFVVADSAGLGPRPFALAFTPPTRADTVQARFSAFVPSAAPDSAVTLPPGSRPGVRFTSPPPASVLASLAILVDGDRQPGAFVTSDGVTFAPDSSTALPTRFALSVRVRDSTSTQRFAVPDARETGSLIGRVDGTGPIFVEVRPQAGPPIVVRADAEGTFRVDGLLPGPHTLRVWADLDGDGRWSGGSLAPYVAPEPLVLIPQPVQVRARWETEIDPITL